MAAVDGRNLYLVMATTRRRDGILVALQDALDVDWRQLDVRGEPCAMKPPEDVRAFIRRLAGKATVDRPIAVVSWHPGVIGLWRDGEFFDRDVFEPLKNVFVWNGDLVRLTDVRAIEWLIHCDLGELYWRGEFSGELKVVRP